MLVEATVDAIWFQQSVRERLDRGPRIPAISDFVEGEWRDLSGRSPTGRVPHRLSQTLNELFRNTLNEVWRKEQPESPHKPPP